MDEITPPPATECPGTDPFGTEPDEEAVPEPPPRLHLDQPREVLAWLPYQVHFWPHESVVLASLRQQDPDEQDGDPGCEPGLVARTDLGIIGSLVGGRQAQVEMSRHLQRDGADRVVCAIYTEQPFAAVLRGEGPAGRTLAWWRTTPWAELGRTYLVGPERFRCVDCSTQPCCPHTGQPLEVLDNTQVSAWCVYHGQTYASSREALVPDPRASAQECARTDAAAQAHLQARPDLAGTALSAWQRDMAHRWVALACAAATREPTAEELGAVLAGLSDTWVRDAALMWSGTGRLLGESLREEVIGAVFSGRLRPQPARVRGADRTLTLLAAHASDRWRAPVLTSRAWLAWWTGDGARANILLQRALEVDADYSLAGLLGTALAHGIPPGWARSAARAS